MLVLLEFILFRCLRLEDLIPDWGLGDQGLLHRSSLLFGPLDRVLLEQEVQFLVGEVDLLGILDDFLDARQNLLLLHVLVLLEQFEQHVDLGHVQLEQPVFHRAEDGEAYVEHEACPAGEDVVPDSYAQLQRETVEEARLEPFLNPHAREHFFLLEMLVQHRQLLLE